MIVRIAWILLGTLAATTTIARDAASGMERHPGLEVEPVALRAPDGAALRAVVTRPAAARGRLPAVLYLQPLSCDSVVLPLEPGDGWTRMLRALVRESGVLVWRTEKRGVGGSEGDCASLDYETELADHRAALAALRARPDVDPDRIVIFGASMGATMAPLLAADEPVAGVAVWGGGARTWAERTLAFERNRYELGDAPPIERASEMTRKFRFIDRWLIGGATPREIAASDPELGAVWQRFAGTDERGMYGRPLAFHTQAQKQDWPTAWTRVRAPVLAMIGEYDWFEDASGVELIGTIVNRGSPGRARVVVFPGYDHHFARHADRRAARTSAGTPDPQPILDVLLPWIRAQVTGSGSAARTPRASR